MIVFIERDPIGCTDDCVFYGNCHLKECDKSKYLPYADACVSCGIRAQEKDSMLCAECERKANEK